jgi:hypothetical protein
MSAFAESSEDSEDDPVSWEHKDTRKVRIRTKLDASPIVVIGSWDDWKTPLPMKRTFNYIENAYQNSCKVRLPPGKYNYKFNLNGEWKHDYDHKFEPNSLGSFDNVLYVDDHRRDELDSRTKTKKTMSITSMEYHYQEVE